MTRTRTNPSIFLSATLAVWALAPSHATAGGNVPGVEIIDVEVGGSGCPEGTATAVPSEDNRKLSIMLDEALVEDDEYASCNVAVSLSVPAGVTVALDMELRGYVDIPDFGDARGRLRAESFFAGGTGPVRIVEFSRGSEGNFRIVSQPGLVWAPCGADVIARVNTSIKTWESGSLLRLNRITIYFHSDTC